MDGKSVKDLPRVEVVYSYANLGRDSIDFLVGKGVKGIVLAGVGDGNTHRHRDRRAGGGGEEGRRRGPLLAHRQRRRGCATSR